MCHPQLGEKLVNRNRPRNTEMIELVCKDFKNVKNLKDIKIYMKILKRKIV